LPDAVSADPFKKNLELIEARLNATKRMEEEA